jgi:hypothetical protein
MWSTTGRRGGRARIWADGGDGGGHAPHRDAPPPSTDDHETIRQHPCWRRWYRRGDRAPCGTRRVERHGGGAGAGNRRGGAQLIPHGPRKGRTVPSRRVDRIGLPVGPHRMDRDKSVATRPRQWAQEHRVYDGEQDGGGADTECKREYGEGRHRSPTPQTAETPTNIGGVSTHRSPSAAAAVVLLRTPRRRDVVADSLSFARHEAVRV